MKSIAEQLQPARKFTVSEFHQMTEPDGGSQKPQANWVLRKIKAWREEQERWRELNAEMQYALIDPMLLNRASIESTQRRIDKKLETIAAEGSKRLKILKERMKVALGDHYGL